jgi:hypothetical protein
MMNRLSFASAAMGLPVTISALLMRERPDGVDLD